MSELRILQSGISPPFQTVIETMSPQVGNRLTPGSSTEVGAYLIFVTDPTDFRQILREKWRFFTDLTRKIGVFRCKFYSPKILPV